LQGIDLTQVLIVFAVLLLSLTVHEASHAWTADRLGDPTARLLGRVSLNPSVHIDPIGTVLFPLIAFLTHLPIIGWAKPVPVDLRRLRNKRRDYLLIAAAGPASNLVLAVLAAVGWRMLRAMGLGLADLPMPLVGFIEFMLRINVMLAVFNMVPVPPLDGGNVLAGLLPEHVAVQFDRLRPYGFLILYGLMLTGLLSVIVIPPANAILSWLV
jgi:Zn-dependent protease